MITDLTAEHPKKTLWRFALPMFMSVMFQQMYNIADSAIAGRFAGEDALAAVGASYPITVIFMAFAVGSNLGASVVVSRLFGAKDLGRMKSAVYTAFIACGAMSLVLTGLGYVFCGAMMEAIHTPANIFGDGELYLKIYVLGLTFLFLYNVCTGIFTALGDSRTPLYFLIGSSVSNVVLDYWFVAGLGMGVAGVAWATFIAQGVSAVLALAALALRLRGIRTDKRVVLFDIILLSQIAAIAVPSIMQQSVLSVGNMFVQEIVNRYGSAVIAGYSGAIKLNTFAINAFMSLGGCLSSYTAQNLGAGKMERIPLGFRTGIRLSLCAAIPFFALYFGFSRQMMGLFLNGDSGEAIASGMEFLRIVSPMYFMISIKLTTDGIIRGSGAMGYFVLATVPDLILRIIVANLLAGRFGSTGIWMAWPFGWVAATVLTIIFYRRIVTGKYRIRL
ncbi:MATE family efflux transporter [Enterocloster citroniae]|uniref:MATE family efflux transporter n=1 Tax=Enterocloster citroniae TaxID=358743 RepID=UPI001D07080A|nr:MATE family efflux transporter [Enterocloster citroniae]MCB7064222.1 MATE family efflux transporter [Enterocloster citroniae]